jgi:glycerophosphoryl diester phosphodiesterase
VPVVFHDESLLRITGSDLLIKDLTLEELRAFDLSYKFRGQCPVQRIPTLEEYFALVKEHDFLNIIELKTAIFEYGGFEQKVFDLVRAFGLSDRVVLSSFNHYSLLRCKNIAPELPAASSKMPHRRAAGLLQKARHAVPAPRLPLSGRRRTGEVRIPA